MGCNEKVQIVEGFFEEESVNIKEGYDFILCSGLLHEVENSGKLLEAIYRICRDDTVVHINVPNAFSLHRLLALEMGIIDDVHQLSGENILFQQSEVYDKELLLSELNSNGFQTLESGTYFCKLFTHQQMQRMIEIGLMTDNMLDGFDKLVEFFPLYGSELFANVKKRI